MKKTSRLWIAAALAAAVGIFVFCSIMDDNGNPANPGSNTENKKGPGSTDSLGLMDSTGRTLIPKFDVEPNIPPAVAGGVVGIIGLNDSIEVRVALFSDTAAGAPVVKGRAITVTLKMDPADAHGSLSRTKGSNKKDTTITTDPTSGVASVKFYSGDVLARDTGRAVLTFESGGLTSSPTIIRISDIDRRMFISAMPARLKADGAEKSTITAQVRNENNNPIVGDVIRFTTDYGFITAEAVTDKDGKAKAELTSDRRNAMAKVVAILKSDGTRNASVDVEFYGVNINVTTSAKTIKPDGDDEVTVTAEVLDAAGNPIVGERVIFERSRSETDFIVSNTTRRATDTAFTDNRGWASCKIVTGAHGGGERITAKAAGATQTSEEISITGRSMKLLTNWGEELSTDPANPTRMGEVNWEDQRFIVEYKHGDGTGVVGDMISFTITAGELWPQRIIFAQDKEMEDGPLTISVKNPDFTGVATVYVKGEGEDGAEAKGFVYFHAQAIHHIELKSTPAVIGVNEKGKADSYADLIAIATDRFGNRVMGVAISFNILEGPGGFEYVDPPTAITDEKGEARVKLIAGTLPSKFEGVKIVASISANPNGDISVPISAPTYVAIAGPAHRISFSYSMKEPLKGEAILNLPVVAIVSDVNYNPIPDNVPVTFKTVVAGYGYYMDQQRPVRNPISREWEREQYKVFVDVPEWVLREIYPLPKFSERNGRYEYFDDIDRSGLPVTFYDPVTGKPVDAEPCLVPPGASGDDCELFACYTGIICDGLQKKEGVTVAEYNAPPYYKLLRRGSTGYTLDIATSIRPLPWKIDKDLPEPGKTTILIERTIQSKGGMADNTIIYGQSDAGKVTIKITVECQGLATESEPFILPEPEEWN